MLKKQLLLPAGLLLSIDQAPAAPAQDVSPGYIVGVWSLQGKDNCGVTGIEHITMLESGTF